MATYVLMIRFTQSQGVTIGAKGERFLEAGHYLYVGSARRAWPQRVARHCRKEKKKRWHIDYVLDAPGVGTPEVWVSLDDRECATCRDLLTLPQVRIAAPGLGSSDCRCPAHLLRLSTDFPPLRTRLAAEGFFCHHPNSLA